MSLKAKTGRTRIADLLEVNAVSAEELNQIDGGNGRLAPAIVQGIANALGPSKVSQGTSMGESANGTPTADVTYDFHD